MKWSTRGAWAGAVLLVAAGLYLAFRPAPVKVEVQTVALRPFAQWLDVEGRTRLARRTVLTAPVAGTVLPLAWREGDRIQAGDVLAQILPGQAPLRDPRAQAEQRAREASARARVMLAQAQLGTWQTAVEQAEDVARRSQTLAAQGFASPAQAQADERTSARARAELLSAQQSLTVAQRELAAVVAAGQVGASPDLQRAQRLRAPADGVVMKLALAAGGPVGVGTPLLELGARQDLEVVADVLTDEALRLRPGQAVSVSLGAWGTGFPERPQARLRRVEPAAFTKVSALGVEEQRVRVLVDWPQPPDEVGDGWRLSLRLHLADHGQVLTVPSSALFPLPQDSPAASPSKSAAVMKVVAGRAQLQAVVVRERQGDWAWVQEGLQAGDEVVVYPPSHLRSGDVLAR